MGVRAHREVIQSIARDIAGLKAEFPQLGEFDPTRHCDAERLVISYGYHTHEPARRGGWTSGVPQPDEDGIWFYIDLHEPDSQAQIHTQPVMPDLRIGRKRVAFLILEGSRTPSVEERLHLILAEHGAAAPPPGDTR